MGRRTRGWMRGREMRSFRDWSSSSGGSGYSQEAGGQHEAPEKESGWLLLLAITLVVLYVAGFAVAFALFAE